MKKIVITLSIAILIGIVSFGTVKANKSYFVPPVQTSTSTTSPQFIGIGTLASSTPVILDAYAYNATALDSAALLVQSVASTSASIQRLVIEYSDDGIDWFSNAYGTSTQGFTIRDTDFIFHTITGNGSASTTSFILNVPTPTRYVRAIMVAKTASSSVWMKFISKREMVN